MRSQSTYIDIAKALLMSPELALGPHSVTCIDCEIAAATGRPIRAIPATCFVIETSGLQSRQSELLALFAEPPTKDELQIVLHAAKRFGVSKPPVYVLPDSPPNAELVTVATKFGVVWTSATLFRHFIALPEHMSSRLREAAAIQRPDEFPYFQEREAIAHVVAGRHLKEPHVQLKEYLKTWLSSHRRKSPILLVGERGSGKTWQLLQFAIEACELHRQDPWTWGPAFFVRLTELVNLLEAASAATPVLTRYVSQRYPDVRFNLAGTALLGALLRIGHTVVCVDGLDEMDLIPTDAMVRARLTTLLIQLSKTTRFVLTSRAAHFSSLESLFGTSAWGDATIADAFEVGCIPVLRTGFRQFSRGLIGWALRIHVCRSSLGVSNASRSARPSGDAHASRTDAGPSDC